MLITITSKQSNHEKSSFDTYRTAGYDVAGWAYRGQLCHH